MNKTKQNNSGSITKPRCGDQRMHRAVAAKQANRHLTLIDCLVIGGFVFPALRQAGLTDKKNCDTDGISLSQRKNQLRRRLRKEQSTPKNPTQNQGNMRTKINKPQEQPDSNLEVDAEVLITIERAAANQALLPSDFGTKEAYDKKMCGVAQVKDSPSRSTSTPAGLIIEIPTSSLGDMMAKIPSKTGSACVNTACNHALCSSQDPELDFDLDQLAIALGLGHLD